MVKVGKVMGGVSKSWAFFFFFLGGRSWPSEVK